jgi:hypothetical protein
MISSSASSVSGGRRLRGCGLGLVISLKGHGFGASKTSQPRIHPRDVLRNGGAAPDTAIVPVHKSGITVALPSLRPDDETHE